MISMSNEIIYDFIKNKDFIIRPFLFKTIKSNNLSTNETMLLIYLINQENPQMDIPQISSITSLTNEEILEAFSNLTDKNLVNTEIKKENDMVIEVISLDRVYKEAATMINNNNKEQTKETIFDIFEKEFNRKLTPMEYEFINAWVGSGMNEEIIIEALKEATYNGVSNLRYIDKIIHEWNKNGYKTIEDIRNRNTNNNNKKDNKVEIFDYNWLDEN